MKLAINRSSPIPLYFQIAEQLEKLISEGELPPGTRLDSEVELAENLMVSRPTMRNAIERLVDKGLVVRRRGLGTVVVPRRVRRPLALTSLHDDLEAEGRSPDTSVLKIDVVPADHVVASALGLDEGADVLFLERLRAADGAPLALMQNHIPLGFIYPSEDDLEKQGLYALLAANGVQIQVANQSVGARVATAREARLLQAGRRATVLTMTRVAYNTAGVAVEYAQHVYLAERYSFEMNLVTKTSS